MIYSELLLIWHSDFDLTWGSPSRKLIVPFALLLLFLCLFLSFLLENYCSAPVLYSVYTTTCKFCLVCFFVLFFLDLLRIKKPDLGRYYHLPAPTRLHRIWTIAPHRESVYHFLSVRRSRLFFFFCFFFSLYIYIHAYPMSASLFFLSSFYLSMGRRATATHISTDSSSASFCSVCIIVEGFIFLVFSLSPLPPPHPPPKTRAQLVDRKCLSFLFFLLCSFSSLNRTKLVRDRHRRPRPSLARPTDTATR